MKTAVRKNTYKARKEATQKRGDSLFTRIERFFRLDAIEDGLPVRFVPYILYFTLVGIFYIGNSHYADKTIRKITKLDQEVQDLRADYTTMKADYMYASKQSEVAARVKKLGLVESDTPPYKIVVEK